MAQPGFDLWLPFKTGIYSQPSGLMAAPNPETQMPLEVILRGLTNFGGNILSSPFTLGYGLQEGAGNIYNWLTTKGAGGTPPALQTPAAVRPANPVAPALPSRASSNTVLSLPHGASGGYMSYLNKGEGTGKNPRSSAYEKGQFIEGTWEQFIKEMHPELMQGQQVFDKPGAKPDRSAWDSEDIRKKYGEEAIAWYARKNAAALQAAGQPVNDWSLRLGHFLDGPVAARVMAADPNTPISQLVSAAAVKANPEVLGGNKTAGDLVKWAQRQMPGAGAVPYPPTVQPQTLPSPPMAGMPPQMAQAPGMDFSQQNMWLDKAKPTPMDPAELQRYQLLAGLGGMASGASKFAPEGGSTGRILAAAGGGGASDFATAKAKALALAQSSDDRQVSYNLQRAQTAGQQMQQQQAIEQQNRQIAFQNAKSIWDTNVNNAEKQYQASVLNKIEEYKANAANDKAHYEWLEKVKEFTTTKILKADNTGFITQSFNPETNAIDVKQTRTDGIEQQMELMGKLGRVMPGGAGEFMKYAFLANTLGKSDPQIAQLVGMRSVISDAISQGHGTYFGKVYENAVKLATEQITKESPGMMTKGPEMIAEVNKRAAGLVFMELQRQGLGKQAMTQLSRVMPEALLFSGE